MADELPTVYVRAAVNVGHLRRGDEGEVELTPTIERMVRSGYLQILGHSSWPVPRQEPAPVANPARTRRKAVTGDGGGGTGGDPA